MADELNVKDIIEKTKNFDQPYAPGFKEGIYEVSVKSIEEKTSAKDYKMLLITVGDDTGRVARVNQMLELQWIEGTIRLIKGLYSHNTEDGEKEGAKDKINSFFDGAKDATDLQNKCIEVLKKLIDKGCFGYLRVEYQNEDDKYPDRALTAYEPTYRWKTTVGEPEVQPTKTEDLTSGGEPTEPPAGLFTD